MIRRGRHFRPLVTWSPRLLPRPSPAGSALVPRDRRWLHSSHLPLSGTGAGLSANRGREATHTSGKAAGSSRFSRRAPRRGRGEAVWRRFPVRLRSGGGFPEATADCVSPSSASFPVVGFLRPWCSCLPGGTVRARCRGVAPH